MLTKTQFTLFRVETELALADLAEKYNANITCGKINYTSDSFSLELKVAKKEVNGLGFEQAEFEKYCGMYGFEKTDYRRKFTTNKNQYTLVGFNSKARTMPVLAVTAEGKRYKFGTYVLKLLEA